ncbi:hypothetical protein D3C81_1739520 [compost metagenome]
MVQRQQYHAIVSKRLKSRVEGAIVAFGAYVMQAHVFQRGTAADHGAKHRPDHRGLLRRRLLAAGQGRDKTLQGALLLRALRVAVGVVGVMQVEVRTFAQQQAEFISLVGHVALEALLARRRHEQLGELVRRGRAPEQCV